MGDLTTEEGLRAYLTTIGYSCKSIEILSGGNANYVWRILLNSNSENGPDQELIVKHAENYLRIDRSLELPPERMDSEAHALQIMSTLLDNQTGNTHKDGTDSPDLAVYTPRVQYYNSENHILIMSSGGYTTLKAAYENMSSAQIESVGVRLAGWIARLHAQTKNTDIGEGGNPIARELYRISYKYLKDTLGEHGLGGPDGELGRIVDDKYGSLLATDSQNVNHGDFWSGNVVLDPAALQEVKVPLTVVDWEMTRRGTGATDVAQFAAEAYLLDRFRSCHRGLAGVFVRKYMELADPSDEFLKRFGIHWGTHMAFWPCKVSWGDKAQTREIAELGAKVIQMAMNDQEGWMRFLMDEFDRYATDK